MFMLVECDIKIKLDSAMLMIDYLLTIVEKYILEKFSLELILCPRLARLNIASLNHLK